MSKDHFGDFLKRHKLAEPTCISGVGPGWIPLLDQLVADLRAAGWKGEFSQIKEKLGALRVYPEDPSTVSAKIWRILGDAEKRSASICDECGKPGTLTQRGCVAMTRCVECAPTNPVGQQPSPGKDSQ